MPGCVQGAIYLISLSVCVSACVCVTFVGFTDCESCTRPISTNPGSMEAGEYELTRGACFVGRCLEVVAIAGLLWISWCTWVRRDFFLLFWYLHFQIRARARDRWLSEIQSSQRRLGEGATTASQSAHGELAPTYPHQLYYLFWSHLRNMAS